MQRKFVIVLDETLPAGLAANAAAVLSATVAKQDGSFIGPDVTDASGGGHPGITALPIPILQVGPERLPDLLDRARQNGLFAAGFTRTAQMCKHYKDYTQRMAETEAEDLDYLGVALYGEAKAVSGLTGGLGLLR